MTEICFGNWHNCPKTITVGICVYKKRDCLVEVSCMRKWLNNKL